MQNDAGKMSKNGYNVSRLYGWSDVLNSPNKSLRVGYTLTTTGTKKWGRSVSITDPLTVARSVAQRIMTLPIFAELTEEEEEEEVEVICQIISSKRKIS